MTRKAHQALREEVPEPLAGERVDRVVALLTGLSRSAVIQLVASGSVRLAGRTVTAPATRVEAGSELEVALPPPASTELSPAPDVEVEVVYADDDVLVVDKPAGMVVHPGAGNQQGTLVQALVARYPEVAQIGQPGRPGVVHRLDKGTSGLLVVARSESAYEALVALLASRQVERRYLALVWGCPRPARGVVDAPVGRSRSDPTRMAVSRRGREARTGYEVRQCFSEPVEVALVGCRLETGRTHQIRVHLGAIGHPVVGDRSYGGDRRELILARPFLHAERLAFEHPITGERLSFDSALPTELSAVMADLR